MNGQVDPARLRHEEDRLLIMEMELRQKLKSANNILILGICLAIVFVGWPIIIWGILARPTRADKQAVEEQRRLVEILRANLRYEID